MCQLRESNVNWAPFYLLLAISKWKTWEKCLILSTFLVQVSLDVLAVRSHKNFLKTLAVGMHDWDLA